MSFRPLIVWFAIVSQWETVVKSMVLRLYLNDFTAVSH